MTIRDFSSIGGLSRAARYDGLTVTQKARDKFRASFLTGHGGIGDDGCKVCLQRIEIPSDLPIEERERRAEALRRLHYSRVSLRAVQVRRARKAAT
jgi:hypothetical protein